MYKKNFIKLFITSIILFLFTACSSNDDTKNKEKLSKTKIINLQNKLYDLTIQSNKNYNASATYIVVMDSNNGNLVAVVDSTVSKNAYKKDETIFEKNVLNYTFEPGAVITPIIYAKSIDNNKTTPFSLINCFKGEYSIANKKITDYHKFDYLRAEDVIVHSSNIGIVQIANTLSSFEMYDTFIKFGFSKNSIFNYEELNEDTGYIPHTEKLKNEIYKATTSYGYGMRTNLLQLVRAYSVFNNNGLLIYPKDLYTFIDTEYENTIVDEPERVISSTTAKKVKNTLIETVKKGTGQKAIYQGVEVGGKTGTSHMVENNLYVNKYHNTFIGFANNENNNYIIGVLVVNPIKEVFASKTAANVFRQVVDIILKHNLF